MTIRSVTGVSRKEWLWLAIIGVILGFAIISGNTWASETASGVAHEFPLSLDSYGDDNLDGIGAKIKCSIGSTKTSVYIEVGQKSPDSGSRASIINYQVI